MSAPPDFVYLLALGLSFTAVFVIRTILGGEDDGFLDHELDETLKELEASDNEEVKSILEKLKDRLE